MTVDKTNTRTFSGDALVLAAMAFFGAYSLFIRLYPLPVLSYLMAFQVVGFAAFVGWAFFRKQAIRRDKSFIPYFVGLAVAATLNDLCYFYAFQETTVAKAAISHQMVSIFLMVLAPLVLKERTTRKEWLATALALAGIVLLFSDRDGGGGKSDAVGILLGLVSAFFYACIIILYRKLQNGFGLSLTTVNIWRYALSAVFLLPCLPLMQHDYSAADLGVLCAFGVLFAVIASAIHCAGMGLTKALHTSIIGKSEPVFAVIYAFFLLHETPSTRVILGGIVIMAVSFWLALHKEPA